MKRLLYVMALLVMAIMIHGTAFAFYAEGEVQQGGDRVFIGNPYDTPDNYTFYILLSDLNKATPEFRKCITGNKFVKVNCNLDHPGRFLVDKTSTCKPFPEYKADIREITGRIVSGNHNEIEVKVPGDVPYTVSLSGIDTPKEFMECISNGRYRGGVTLSVQFGHSSADHVWFRANRAATCARK
jgi:hypothetical protein